MSSKEAKAKGRVLLPTNVIPVRYDLQVTPNFDTFTFEGDVSIELTVHQDQLVGDLKKQITLHSKELCYVSASYKAVGDAPAVAAEEIRVNLKATTVTFCFPDDIPAAASETLVLSIQFSGFLNNQMAGFYRSKYTDIEGKEQWMASTQFEALDARRAFPCFDEPSRKAVFGFTMTIPSHLHVFSNMPEKESISLSKTKKQVSFLDTPKMSTYLLAYCVGEFDCVQAQTQNGVLVKVYAPPGKSASGAFALECATKCLDHYDEFFGVPYPLPKLDMVAIPEFAMGAMENWGLVTYREVDLLIDPVKASSSQKSRVATVVNHELAHQWFGNLVTMEWWDDLWLNEGFASWTECWASDKIFPDWGVWENFTTDHLANALRLDALKSSHPIQVPIAHAEEVEQVFDAISYSKGASVIRMIKAVLGMKNFQTGLQAYMKKHAYGNTETVDLWQAWEESSGLPVRELMASWTEQMGFPMLKVTKETWEETKVTFELEQEWFLSDGSELLGEDAAKKWTIPVISCTEAGTQEDIVYMREKTATVTIPIQKGGWAKLNANHETPMRVLSTAEMLTRLSAGVKNKKLSACDRAGLVNDSYALVKAGHMAPEELIKLLANYKNEDSLVAWDAVTSALVGLDAVLTSDEKMNANFQTFAKNLLAPIAKKVGWEFNPSVDTHQATLLRSLIVGCLGRFSCDDPDVAAEATKRFQAFQADHNDTKSLPSDIRGTVFKIVLKNGGEAEYNAVKAYYAATDNNAERKHVLNTVGATPDAKLKTAVMEWSTSGDIKIQDFFYLMGSVGRSSKEGREISWKYYKDNLGRIQEMLGKASPSLMNACIVFCAGGACTNGEADDIEGFFQENPMPQSSRRISQLLEGIRANAKFLDVLQASSLSKEDFWASL